MKKQLNQSLKQAGAMLLCITMLFLGAGCQKQENTAKGSDKRLDDVNYLEQHYSNRTIRLPDKVKKVDKFMFSKGHTYIWADHELYRKISVEDDWEKLKCEVEEGSEITALGEFSDGSLMAMISGMTGGVGTYWIARLSKEGEVLSREQSGVIEGVVNLGVVNQDDNICFFAGDSGAGFVYDQQGNYLERIEKSEMFGCCGVALTVNGSYVRLMNAEQLYAEILTGEGETEKKLLLHSVIQSYASGDIHIYQGDDDYSFYFDDSTSLYGYRADGCVDCICLFSDILLDGKNSKLTVLEGGNILAYDEGLNELSYYEKSRNKDERIVLELAGLDFSLKEDVISLITRFNKTNTKYRIHVTDYSVYEHPDTKLNTDLNAGNIPDIMYLSGVSYRNYVHKGMLADLIPFLTSPDAKVSETDLFAEVISGAKEDNRLLELGTGITGSYLMGKKKMLKGKEHFTPEEFLEAAGQLPDSTTMFPADISAMEVLNQSMDVDDYVDWSKWSCNFETDTFEHLLEYAKEYSGDAVLWADESQQEELSRDRIALTSFFMTNELADYAYLQYLMQERQLTPLPTPSASHTGYGFTFENPFGIMEKSEHKDGAWEFFEYFLSEEIQSGLFQKEVQLTYRRDCYQQLLADKKKQGVQINNVSIDGVKEDVIAAYDQMFSKLSHLCWTDEGDEVMYDQIRKIISEEAGEYFEGKAKSKEAISHIQSRVSIMLDESR